MPKTISTELRDHLDEEVTTIATLWQLTRTDGVSYYFTDHDQDLEFEGNTYRADVGYTRTAISNSSTLNVDNLDLVGFIDSEEITDQDIRAGRFDYAEIFIVVVNWADLSQGTLRLRRGRVGEITLTDQGFFKAELRGLTQQLSQVSIIELYSPECRADLGDSRCKVPIDPPQVERSTAYAVGDYVKNDNATSVVSLSITNHSFETGDLTGWTTTVGTPETATSNGAQDGTYFVRGDLGTGSFTLEQVVDFSGDVDTTKLDNGEYEFDFSAYRCNTGDALDTGRVLVEWQNGAGTYISDAFDTGLVTSGSKAGANPWALVNDIGIAPPVGARRARIILSGVNDNGTTANVGFDNLSGTFRETAIAGSETKVPFVNGSFETDDVTGWTELTGNMNVQTLDSDEVIVDGAYFLRVDDDGNEIEQVVDMTSLLDTAEIDAGNYTVDFNCYRGNDAASDDDTGRVIVELLDATDTVLSTPLDTGDEAFGDIENGWTARGFTDTTVPANTRKIRVYFTGTLVTGFTVNACMDDVRATFKRAGSAADVLQEEYENRIYRCSVAGTTMSGTMSYSRVVDSVNVDGGATFICEQAWTRHFEVSAVTNRTTFSITVTETRAVDDWFNLGVLGFETGDNSGLNTEIRDWTQTGSEIVLFEASGYDIQVGDKGFLYPGCDKRIETCGGQFSNVINMRAEPYIPGQDEYLNYPDAK